MVNDVAMRTTVTIDDDVLAVARALSERRGISLGSALSELARRGFRGTAAARNDDDGVPVFHVRADAEPITREDRPQGAQRVAVTALLDVNVVIALASPNHLYHEARRKR
ncbi:MAG: hypothetical protein OXU75_17565 [Deltaproteobacteria bacterium]|nr:hypothetical protein [Deltaproteobacteria bacterium]